MYGIEITNLLIKSRRLSLLWPERNIDRNYFRMGWMCLCVCVFFWQLSFISLGKKFSLASNSGYSGETSDLKKGEEFNFNLFVVLFCIFFFTFQNTLANLPFNVCVFFFQRILFYNFSYSLRVAFMESKHTRETLWKPFFIVYLFFCDA